MKVFKRRTKTGPQRRWEDRQLVAGYDPRVLIELQAIADRAHSERAMGVGVGRSAWGVGPGSR
jgi:hypothetical protein